jgi:hypothetical protein
MVIGMYGNITTERNRTGDKLMQRMEDINKQLGEWTQRVGSGYDVSMECGDSGAWVEMNVTVGRSGTQGGQGV